MVIIFKNTILFYGADNIIQFFEANISNSKLTKNQANGRKEVL